jgi:hypothetical protein
MPIGMSRRNGFTSLSYDKWRENVPNSQMYKASATTVFFYRAARKRVGPPREKSRNFSRFIVFNGDK